MNEDVFPIEHGDFPASHVSFQGCKASWPFLKAPLKQLRCFFCFFASIPEVPEIEWHFL